MLETVVAKLIEVAATAAAAKVAGAGRTAKSKIVLDKSQSPRRIALLLKETESWTKELGVTGLLPSRRLADVFVDIDLNLQVLRIRGSDKPDRSHTISKLNSLSGNLVILGAPGAGKSTALRHMISAKLSRVREAGSLPVLVRLRKLGRGDSLLDFLMERLGLVLRSETEGAIPETAIIDCLATFLDRVSATVFLDGLDEVPTGDLAVIENELERLMRATQAVKFVLTSRSAVYRRGLPESTTLELSPLSRDQVVEFAEHWLSASEAGAFVRQLQDTPYAGTGTRPLTLVQLLMLYERKGRIPDLPRTVYRAITRMFTEDWDAYRGVKRETEFSGFTPDRKQEFLEAVAALLTLDGVRGSFAHENLRDAYWQLYDSFGLPRNAAARVCREIESHNGLLLEAGPGGYEFFHRSIQEYLTAEFIVKSGHVDFQTWTLEAYPDELAIAVALSTSPGAYLARILSMAVLTHWSRIGRVQERPVQTFVDRLTIEKPTWRKEQDLGQLFLLLMDVDGRYDARHWEGLLTAPLIREAVREVLHVYPGRRDDAHYVVEIDIGTTKMTAERRIVECRVPHWLKTGEHSVW